MHVKNGLPFERPILEILEKIEELKSLSEATGMDLNGEVKPLEQRCATLTREIFAGLSPWEKVQVARHPLRPLTTDFLELMTDDFMELHGDRVFGDDAAIVSGFGRIDGEKFMIIGHRKGRDTKAKLRCNFGCAHPEGYRKALHKMKIAETFGLPVLTLINTPGAYPGIGAEERGQAWAIAENIMEMSRLRVPVIAVVIGEGGSGGALGIGVGDRVLMLEHSYYSVISPEGCAAILWKSGDMAETAAHALRLTATDLHGFGVVDEIVPEPLGGAHRDREASAELLKSAILRNLREIRDLPVDVLLAERYEKYRHLGSVLMEPEVPVVESAETVSEPAD
jgi:acetyl-CoA carboxylase carboxyl transferase subunit alpha